MKTTKKPVEKRKSFGKHTQPKSPIAYTRKISLVKEAVKKVKLKRDGNLGKR